MNDFTLSELFSTHKPVIGMLHLPPLPGSPGYGGELLAVRDFVLRDAAALVEGGVAGLLLENYGDVPFFPERVPHHVVAHLTAIAVEIRRRFSLPLGINVLRNDGRSALAVAHAAGAEFIRVNILCGARLTDQGVIQGIAHDLLRERKDIGAERVRIFADVNVKHSAPLGDRPLSDEVADTIERGGADAVIVSGQATGHLVDQSELRQVRQSAGKTPLLVGSGVTVETIGQLSTLADGFIVGTALKQNGLVTGPVVTAKVRELIAAVG